ncbi:MAG: peptidase M50, partial [Hyphomicrobium sp.]
MAVQRPTFSESWYRVADLRPRLRPHAQVFRQHYRGRRWYVVQNASRSQFFRLSEPAYHFLGMLDARRSVASVWRICLDRLGDDAPTQGEVIKLLGQLYAANMLQVDLPGDTGALFRRYRNRIGRDVRSALMSPLSVRIPLFDPDHFLEQWAGVVGKLFTPIAGCVWLALIVFALSSLAGRGHALVVSGGDVLSRDNLVLLYLAFVAVKIVHEFAHGFACKHLGTCNGSGGQVHMMGIMLLVLMPVPFVDASSAWSFKSRWHRILVAVAGMYAELAIAAFCAVVWVHTAEGTLAHAICFNVMFVASVSTLMFNGNPLLRYDGYFVLSDLLEMPNLAQRSKEYVIHLVKRFAWNVDRTASSAHTQCERKWLFSYAIGSTVYRVFVCFSILLFIADKLFVAGMILAAAAVFSWVVIPLGRVLKYLLTSSELLGVRPRAIGSTVAACTLVTTVLFLLPVADYRRAEGIVEPRDLAVIHASVDGFVKTAAHSGSRVDSAGPHLVTTSNRELGAERAGLVAVARGFRIQHRLALDEKDFAKAQALVQQIASVERNARHLAERER